MSLSMGVSDYHSCFFFFISMKRAKELFIIHIVDMASKDLYDSKYMNVKLMSDITIFFAIYSTSTLLKYPSSLVGPGDA